MATTPSRTSSNKRTHSGSARGAIVGDAKQTLEQRVTDEDDDFWTTYIASTPEEDADFAGCGPILAGFFLAAVLLGLLLWAAR